MRRSRTFHLYRAEGPVWTRYTATLRAQELLLYAAPAGDAPPPAPEPPPPPPAAAPDVALDVENAVVTSPEAPRAGRRFCIDLVLRGGVPVHLSAEGKPEQEALLGALAAATVAEAWPGGRGLNKRPQPLLYSMWAVQHAGSVAVLCSGEAGLALEARVPSPFPRLPALKAVPAWQRKGLLLQKLRQCSIVFDGVPGDRFAADREVKRNTLLEVLDHFEAGGKAAMGDARVLEDAFTVIRLNLFRAQPVAPEPSGDPEEEEVAFSDPQWPHLGIVYELLRRLVASEHLELALKKRLLDAPFVRGLLLLFDSDDAREREFLKQVAHSIYSRLTLRRALIRRAVCNVFFETVLEGGEHRGVAELLEVLSSIINGFAVPIKGEHRAMLVRALLPLHKARAVAAYHAPLSYCMVLFASKDHALTRDIVPALLRFWPFASAQKQLLFLNELEDVVEYVQVRARAQKCAQRARATLLTRPRPPTPHHTHTHARAAGERPALYLRAACGPPRVVHWGAPVPDLRARTGAVGVGALLPAHPELPAPPRGAAGRALPRAAVRGRALARAHPRRRGARAGAV